MRDSIQRYRKKAQSVARESPQVLAVLSVIVLVVTGGVAAQAITETFTDDFEDGNVDGWESPEGETPVPSSDSVEGSWSLLAETEQLSDQPQPAFLWKTGPVLDMSEDFTVQMVVKPFHSGGNTNIRIGIAGSDQTASGENAFIIFDEPNSRTYLATSATEEPDSSAVIQSDYNDQWVIVTLTSDSGSDTLEATVQLYSGGTEETITAGGFEGISGQFALNPGFADDEPRDIYLDSVEIEGQRATDPNLSLETRSLYQPGETHSYKVTETRNESGYNVTYNVTENATVESLNSSVLSVNENNNTLTATSQEDTAQVVLVRATYNDSTTYQEVTVAKPTVENLEIVPGIWRITAVLGDSAIFALLVAALLAVGASRFAGAYAGLGTAEMVVVIGWFGGYIPLGVALLSVFTAIFIGLNLAENTTQIRGLGG